jgi:alpha-galactosidase
LLAGLVGGALTVGACVAASMTVDVLTAAPAAALNNGLARTPQMGWNDWNAYGCNVNEQLVEQTADAMVANGMKAAGYDYVNIDDCWLEKQRDANGNLVPDPNKFPDGIKGVADYVHSKGLKLGIYEDAGTATCAGYPGSLGHEQQDAATFASWGVDYLKYDNCNNAGSTTKQQYIDRYTAMRDALEATGRPILYSLCEWGVNDPWTWAAKVGNSWRTTGDIRDSYDSMLSIFNANVWLYLYSHPGAWNDPDMLEIGNGGMTVTEEQSEFSLWAAMDAPLIAGTNVADLSPAELAIYTNQDVIDVNQDPLGKQAKPLGVGGHPAGYNGLWVLSKPLANGDRAVVLFNSTSAPAAISTTATHIGMPSANDYGIRDLWTHTTSETAGRISATVPAHGTVMYRVSKGRPGGTVAPNVTLDLSGVPANATPAAPFTAAVKLANNGRTTINQASLTVSAPADWTVTPLSGTLFAKIRTDDTVRARFRLTPPDSTSPLETDTITGRATYSYANKQADASVSVTTLVNSPVQAPYETYSSATDAPAQFGQSGDAFGISGAGADIYSGHDDYSAIYRPDVVSTSGTVQVTVSGYEQLSGYGKTGIMVRDNINAAYTAPEGVLLYVSPEGGIQLEYDNNSGEYINSVTPPNGTIPPQTPVVLKLVRAGDTYTGTYSIDGGATWHDVGSASVPGQADTQDAGMFLTSHSAGSPAVSHFQDFAVS